MAAKKQVALFMALTMHAHFDAGDLTLRFYVGMFYAITAYLVCVKLIAQFSGGNLFLTYKRVKR